ncbi:MAG: S-layer homology domain-containing protein [Syntrophomonadaceae bacterium]|nr:S-layer homology domain-containing protein [Syntrophomonadaceae bacterium]
MSPAASSPSGGGGGGDGGGDYSQPAEPETPAEAADTDTIDDESVPLAEPGAIWDNPFIDVKEGDWFYADVEYTHLRGLIMGTSGNTFSPVTSTTRGMIVTILYRHAGSPNVSALANPFSDAAGKYYTDAVKWGAANNIVVGVGGGRFEPEAPVTRQDLAVIVANYAKSAGLQFPVTLQYQTFTDESDIAEYAKNAVQTLYGGGIVSGKLNNIFDPLGESTRAEVASMLHRFLEAAGK